MEGALLHVATHMIERNLTEVRSILIELGDFKAHMMVKDGDGHAQLDAATGFRTRRRRARPAWRLQALGYSVYLINVHMNMELFDWRGVDVNLPSASHQMAPHQDVWDERCVERRVERGDERPTPKGPPPRG